MSEEHSNLGLKIVLHMETHTSNWKAIVYLQCHTLLLAHLLSPNTLSLGMCEVRGRGAVAGREKED